MKIQTSQKVLGYNDDVPEVQEVTVKELREATQDYLIAMFENAHVFHHESPMGKLEDTEEFDAELAKQINRVRKLFGYVSA